MNKVGQPFSLGFEITKVDEDKREVWGIATAEVPDHQDDIVDYLGSKEAFDAWAPIGNIREQHDAKKAVGTAFSVQHLDSDKSVFLGVRISKGAEDTYQKVKDGTLKGFSIQGKVLKSQPELLANGRKGNRILKYSIAEVSLVDNPACPIALVSMVKSVDGHAQGTYVVDDGAPPVLDLTADREALQPLGPLDGEQFLINLTKNYEIATVEGRQVWVEKAAREVGAEPSVVGNEGSPQPDLSKSSVPHRSDGKYTPEEQAQIMRELDDYTQRANAADSTRRAAKEKQLSDTQSKKEMVERKYRTLPLIYPAGQVQDGSRERGVPRTKDNSSDHLPTTPHPDWVSPTAAMNNDLPHRPDLVTHLVHPTGITIRSDKYAQDAHRGNVHHIVDHRGKEVFSQATGRNDSAGDSLYTAPLTHWASEKMGGGSNPTGLSSSHYPGPLPSHPLSAKPAGGGAGGGDMASMGKSLSKAAGAMVGRIPVGGNPKPMAAQAVGSYPDVNTAVQVISALSAWLESEKNEASNDPGQAEQVQYLQQALMLVSSALQAELAEYYGEGDTPPGGAPGGAPGGPPEDDEGPPPEPDSPEDANDVPPPMGGEGPPPGGPPPEDLPPTQKSIDTPDDLRRFVRETLRKQASQKETNVTPDEIAKIIREEIRKASDEGSACKGKDCDKMAQKGQDYCAKCEEALGGAEKATSSGDLSKVTISGDFAKAMTTQLIELNERLAKVEAQPVPGGPAVRAVAKAVGGVETVEADDVDVQIAALIKARDASPDQFSKNAIGGRIAELQIRQGFAAS